VVKIVRRFMVVLVLVPMMVCVTISMILTAIDVVLIQEEATNERC
jgi:hypothetical protein